MTPNEDSKDKRPAGVNVFATTHWSVVLNAADETSDKADLALSKLCETYWYPLYAFVRRQGHNADDAKDLTQAYFARLLEKNFLADVDRRKGKFRSFLLASMKHFLANEWDRAKALKRGGGQTIVSFDAQSAETRYRQEPRDNASADIIYERRWALTLLERVLQGLRGEYGAQGKDALFDRLKATLTVGRSTVPYAEIGRQLDMSEGAVKVAVHRLRQRYREMLRSEISDTVSSPEEVEEEIRYLFQVLSRDHA